MRERFERYGPIEEVQVVYDHQTGRSRGFAFVYYEHHEDAAEVLFVKESDVLFCFLTRSFWKLMYFFGVRVEKCLNVNAYFFKFNYFLIRIRKT